MDLSPRAREIADHAEQLLAEGGYNGFSYADLSERVHIGKASIHHHFPSKADLVLTVVRRHRQHSLDALTALQDQYPDDPGTQLRAYADYWATCIRDNTPGMCMCAMLAAESPMIPPYIAAEVKGFFMDLTTWITTVITQGAARAQFGLRETPSVEAQTFLSTIYGAILMARTLGDPDVFRITAHAALDRLSV